MTTLPIHHRIDYGNFPMSKEFGEAINALRDGKPILLLDAHDRENEGDLVIAAEKITPESMNFLIKKGSGIVCLAMPKERLLQLNLPLMISENTNFFQTAFTVSIEASQGVTTGVSAKDRAHTMQVAMADDAKASDLARPGHVFPLAARLNGVFERMGHTEGSVDLMRIAGLKAGAALCELMNDDGSMTVGEDRVKFAERYNIPVISVEEILFFRIQNEDVVSEKRETIKTLLGDDLIYHRFNFFNGITIDAYYKPDWQAANSITTRIVTLSPNERRDAINDKAFHSFEADIVMMASSVEEKGVKTLKERHIHHHAALCKTWQKLLIKNITSINIDRELARIAQTYFAINVF